MAIRPDWNIGKINLVAGSAEFTTVNAMLNMSAVEPGDVIITPSGHILVIKEITGANSGTLMLPCPTDAAGTDLPLRIRFQPDGSRLAGALRSASALLSGGNVEAFAELTGQPDMVPVFTGAGTMGLTPINVLAGGGGSWDALSPDIAGLSVYEAEPVEFRVLVINNGEGKSAIYQKTGTGNAWSSPIPFTGPTGATNTLTIGTVTEGPIPAAYITGNAPNQVLNLELVRGVDGDPGPTGDVTPAALAAKEAAEKASNKSEEWASNPVDAEVEAGKFSALHYAMKAKEENESATAGADIVRDNKPNIDAIAGNIISIDLVAQNEQNINAVAANAPNINEVSAISDEVTDVAAIKSDITSVRANAANINAVSSNKQNIDIVAENATQVSAVAEDIVSVKSAADNLAAIIAAPDNARDAAEARDYAHDWATAPEDTLIDDGERQGYSAYHYSKKAQAIAGGGVTSVGMELPDSLVVNIPSITSSGVFVITHATGYQGYTTAEAQRLAGMQDNADVTTTARVGAALAGPTPSTDLSDGDKFGGILSGGASLATWSWATVKAAIKLFTDTLYASKAQGGKADTAVQKVNGKTGTEINLSASDINAVPSSKIDEIDANTSARHSHSNKNVLDAITAAYTLDEKQKLATVASNADVTTTAKVGAALAGPTPSTDLSDGDKFGGILSGGAVLASWSWATVKTAIKLFTDTLYATKTQFTSLTNQVAEKQDKLNYTPVNNAGDNLSGGFVSQVVNDGNKSNGIYTPTPTGGNYRLIVCSGSFTLTAPTVAGDCQIIIKVGMGAGAGTITFTGFTMVDGADLESTIGKNYLFIITKVYDVITLDIKEAN